MADACPARGRDEVPHRGDVLVAGALRGAVHDRVHARHRVIYARACEQLTPVPANGSRVAVSVTAAQRMNLMTRGHRRGHHPPAQRASRPSDEDMARHGTTIRGVK